VLGAEAKNKKLGVSYSSGSAVGSAAQFSFIPFFVYATEAEEEELGTKIDVRKARGNDFYQYNYTSNEVRTRVIKFLDLILEV
ncbi:MAG: hypothetical protein ACI86H_001657, partial [bacterium]